MHRPFFKSPYNKHAVVGIAKGTPDSTIEGTCSPMQVFVYKILPFFKKENIPFQMLQLPHIFFEYQGGMKWF